MHTFNVGERVEVSKIIDLLPYTILIPGEKGTVVSYVNDMGIEGVEIEMDAEHEGLRLWNNRAFLTDPELANLAKVKPKQHLRRIFVYLVVAVTALRSFFTTLT